MDMGRQIGSPGWKPEDGFSKKFHLHPPQQNASYHQLFQWE
jgi:hypothetical protein